MIAVDTHLLVYAHRTEFPWQPQAAKIVLDLAAANRPWAIPWPCIHEFINVVTKATFRLTSTLRQTFDAIDAWLSGGSLHMIGEGGDHLALLQRIAEAGHASGPRIHDARIAAICIANGVSELWSADRDFSRFPELKVVNPLVQ